MTVDYVPIANGGSANVESQAQYLIDLAVGGTLVNGYQAGLAKSIQINKTLRQSSMVSAAVANFIANALSISVLDDGNLSTLTTNLTNAIAAASATGVKGQCRLTKSGSNLLLIPYNGNQLTINGAVNTIPSAGVSLTTSGLSASTKYYIYAYMSSGTMTLEASATGYATNTTTGITQKSGDATRSLVGMAYTTAGAAFADTVTQRFVISYYGRKSVYLLGSTTSGTSTNSSTGTLTEINSAARVEGITWADEAVQGYVDGYGNVSAAANYELALGLNGSTQVVTASLNTAPNSSSYGNIASAAPCQPSEGYFNLTALAGGITGGATATYTFTVSGLIRG